MFFSQQNHKKAGEPLQIWGTVCLGLLAAAFESVAEDSFLERTDFTMFFPVIQRAALSQQHFHFS